VPHECAHKADHEVRSADNSGSEGVELTVELITGQAEELDVCYLVHS
jgi:hypothetical protein